MNYRRLATIVVFLVSATALVAARPAFSPTNAVHTSCSSSGGLRFYPKAFTKAETSAIIKLMKTLPVEIDERVDKSVNRTNYFDKGPAITSPESKYSWIFERIRSLYAPNESMEKFVSRIDFILLHEFEQSGFFDWHIDTKPGDGTLREDNINVMLSDRAEYEGGILTVGGDNVEADRGDCYAYPASFPHKVGDITGGIRHTFIIAMTSSKSESSDLERQKYWDSAEENYKQLCESIPTESKLHMLHGEFLAARGRPSSEVDAKFADMYASTPEAEQYANNFSEQGKELAQMGRTEESKGYLAMADMIRNRASNF